MPAATAGMLTATLTLNRRVLWFGALTSLSMAGSVNAITCCGGIEIGDTRGAIWAVVREGKRGHIVQGYGCELGNTRQMPVLVFVGRKRDGGVQVATAVANLQPRPQDGVTIQAACGTANGHRFEVHLPPGTPEGPIFVYGLTSANRKHPLPGSGDWPLAVARAGDAIGGLQDVVSEGGGQWLVRGWACAIGEQRSLPVLVYVGRKSDGGVQVAEGVANHPSRPGLDGRTIHNECEVCPCFHQPRTRCALDRTPVSPAPFSPFHTRRAPGELTWNDGYFKK